MTKEEIKERLTKAAASGSEKRFDELAQQLEPTDDNRILIHIYNGVLLSHPRVMHNINK